MSELLPEPPRYDDWAILEEALMSLGSDPMAFEALAAIGRLRDGQAQLVANYDERQGQASRYAGEARSADARVLDLELELEEAQTHIRAQNVRIAKLEETLGQIAIENPRNRDRAKSLKDAARMARQALGKK